MPDTNVLSETEHFTKLTEAIERGDDAEITRLTSQEVFDALPQDDVPPAEAEVPAVTEEVEAPEGTTDAPASDPQADATTTDKDWLAALPEDVQARVKEEQQKNTQLLQQLANAQHTIQSDAGRVRAYQKKLDELQRRPEVPPAASAPNSEDRGLAGLEALAEDDPKFAEALKNFAAQVRQDASAEARQVAESVLKPMQDESFSNFVAQQQDIVRQNIPNVAEVVTHPHFQNWLARETDQVRKMAGSPHSADAFNVIRLYETQLRIEDAAHAPPKVDAPVAPAANTEAADKVAGARATRPQAPAKPADAKVTSLAQEVDVDKLFDQFYKEESKKYNY